MQKLATTEFPILDVLKERWSPRAYADRPVEAERLWSLLEAARWSPSSSNAQPWSFIVARKGEAAFDKLAALLSVNNQKWAPSASVLILSIAKLHHANGNLNRHAYYDVGQAVAHLNIQAESFGLHVRQMGGFDVEAARSAFEIPEGYDPVTVLAVGYFGDVERLNDDMQQRERADRIRKPFTELVFTGKFGQPAHKPVVVQTEKA